MFNLSSVANQSVAMDSVAKNKRKSVAFGASEAYCDNSLFARKSSEACIGDTFMCKNIVSPNPKSSDEATKEFAKALGDLIGNIFLGALKAGLVISTPKKSPKSPALQEYRNRQRAAILDNIAKKEPALQNNKLYTYMTDMYKVKGANLSEEDKATLFEKKTKELSELLRQPNVEDELKNINKTISSNKLAYREKIMLKDSFQALMIMIMATEGKEGIKNQKA